VVGWEEDGGGGVSGSARGDGAYAWFAGASGSLSGSVHGAPPGRGPAGVQPRSATNTGSRTRSVRATPRLRGPMPYARPTPVRATSSRARTRARRPPPDGRRTSTAPPPGMPLSRPRHDPAGRSAASPPMGPAILPPADTGHAEAVQRPRSRREV